MAQNRKLNRPSDQRKAAMRSMVTALLYNGRIETTEAKAKEVRKVAEKLLTAAIKTYDGNVEVSKQVLNEKQQPVTKTFVNDTPAKLNARRQLVSYLYNIKEPRQYKENMKMYKLRTSEANFPVVEKVFRELAPKYKKRAEEKGQGGGYTRIIKMGPRRGDAAEMVILELV